MYLAEQKQNVFYYSVLKFVLLLLFNFFGEPSD